MDQYLTLPLGDLSFLAFNAWDIKDRLLDGDTDGFFDLGGFRAGIGSGDLDHA